MTTQFHKSVTKFELHPQLIADTVQITSLELCQVLLMQDNRYPWLILVPQRNALRDLHDLSEYDQMKVISEINQASHVLKALYTPDKINVAALGNIVSQLHIHVIARLKKDNAWPAPVWGIGQKIPYHPTSLQEVMGALREAFILGIEK